MKEIQVFEKELIRLESCLNEIRFKGIPIGGLIASALNIELYMGNGDWSLKARIKDLLIRVQLYLPLNQLNKSKGGQHLKESIAAGKALMTFSSSRQHIFNMSYVFWQSLNEDPTCLLLDKSARGQFSDGDQPNVVLSSDIPECSLFEWIHEFRRVIRQIRKELKAFVRDNNLPRYVSFRIENYLVGQTQKLLAYETFLQQVKPRYVLVEYDRFHIASPLVLAGKLAQIPTFTMVHGAINNKIGYLPVLADRLFCWGNRQREQLLDFSKTENINIDPSRIEVVGALQISDNLGISKAHVREKLRTPDHKKVVLLATNAVRMELRHRLITLFCEALQGHEGIQGIVRIHPSEEPSFYWEYLERYPKIIIDVDQKLTYEESLAIADIVCIYNSAFGLDALLKLIPIIVIDIESEGLGHSRDLIDSGKIPVADTSNTLIETIKQYLHNETNRAVMDSHVSLYAKQYCAAFGEDAAINIRAAIESYLANHTSEP